MDGDGDGDGRSGDQSSFFRNPCCDLLLVAASVNSALVFDVAQRACLALTHHGTSLVGVCLGVLCPPTHTSHSRAVSANWGIPIQKKIRHNTSSSIPF